jgi:citronellol/citronellal dehydrogenase
MFKIPDLTDRVAIVTGASRGIGKALALALAKAGCNICVAAKSTESRPGKGGSVSKLHAAPGLPGSIHETKSEIEALGRKAIAVKTNVREESEIANMVAQTKSAFGRIDILINNAGALWWKSVAETPASRFDLVMDVNARASFLTAQYCLPHMKENAWGHIINMSPPIDLSMLPGKVAYCISKFGMTLVAFGLAQEVRGDGIACNALWPATVIESQATINFGLGHRSQWRKADILADAVLAIVGHDPQSLSGQAIIDEQILSKVGVSDFDAYRCEEGGELIRIVGEDSVSKSFGTGAGGAAQLGSEKSD